MRETAALALGQLGDNESAPALITGAKQEPWPFVRRAELEALGHLCAPGAADLCCGRSPRTSTTCAAPRWSGLTRCKDKRARTVLLKVVAHENEGATVRELAAALLGESGDKARGAAARDRVARGWSTKPRATWRWKASPRPPCAPSPASAAPTPSAPR